MSKAIIFVGFLVILHTIIAKITGIPEISDYLPITWFGGKTDNSEFYKVVETSEKSFSWVYTLAAGVLLVALGFLLNYSGKNGSV